MLVQSAMQAPPVTINAQQTLPEAVLLLHPPGVQQLLVLQEGNLVGILTDGHIRRALTALGTRHSAWDFAYQIGSLRVQELMQSEVLTARPGDDLNQAISTMLDRHVNALPVVNHTGSLMGLLTVTDVLRTVSTHRLPLGTVGQHMSTDPVTVPPELPLSEAAARMVITRLCVLPVVRDQVLLGVLHDHDIRALLVGPAEAHGPTFMEDHFYLEGKTVADLMARSTAEASVDTPLADAVEVMLATDVHGLPVVGNGHTLLGVMTMRDVLAALVAQEVHPPQLA